MKNSFKLLSCIYTTILFSFTCCFSYEHTIAICSVFKNEAPWLKEWIEYHQLLGVSHFRLYNNESSDHFLAVLDPYIKEGIVTLLDWPNQIGDWTNWAYLRQWPAYVDGLGYLKQKAKWVALIDTDEFILPLEDPDIITFLERYDSFPGIVLNWQCFGTSFIQEIPEGELMIENLTLKAREYSRWNKPVKSIVKPECVDIDQIAWAPHTVCYLNHQVAVFPDGFCRKETLQQHKWEIHSSKAVINHYVHRTEPFFWKEKLTKKAPMKNWAYLKDPNYVDQWYHECNEEEDFRIFRFIPKLKEQLHQITF